MVIKILGGGCAKCLKLEQNVIKAAEEAGITYLIEKVTDTKEILTYGVPITPALLIDGEVKSVGIVPSPDKIKEFFS